MMLFSAEVTSFSFDNDDLLELFKRGMGRNEDFSISSESKGSKVLSQFGEEFFESLEKVVKEHQAKRDREVSKMDGIKAEQEKLDNELREILEDQENRTQIRLSTFEQSNDTLEKETNDSRLTNRDVSPDPVISEDTNAKSKKRVTPDSGKSKVLHKKEWVNVFEPTEVFNNYDTSGEMTEKELLQHEKLVNMHEAEAMQAVNSKDSSPSDLTEDARQADKPPVKNKTKKKMNYVPNTFVPNRTLQLRRSGSLTKLSNVVPENKSDGKSEFPVKDQEERQKCSANQRTARSGSRERPVQSLPQKPRPAFR